MRQSSSPLRPLIGIGALVLTQTALVCTGDRNGCPTMGNDVWQSIDFEVQVDIPTTCPVKVDESGEVRYYAASVFGPANAIESWLYTWIFNSDAVLIIQQHGETPFYYVGPNTAQSQVQGTYPVGTVTARYAVPYPGEDRSLHQVIVTGNQLAEGTVRLPFEVGIVVGLSGPTSVYVGQTNTWKGVASNYQGAPEFRWLVNGVAQAGEVDSSFSYARSSAGSFTLSSIARDDFTAMEDTITQTVTARFSVGISGPSLITNREIARWSASTVGGIAPFTYTWYWNGVKVGTSASYTRSSTSAGSHEVSLVVNDAVGNGNNDVKYVEVCSLSC